MMQPPLLPPPPPRPIDEAIRLLSQDAPDPQTIQTVINLLSDARPKRDRLPIWQVCAIALVPILMLLSVITATAPPPPISAPASPIDILANSFDSLSHMIPILSGLILGIGMLRIVWGIAEYLIDQYL